MRYNLDSPNRLLNACDLDDLPSWYREECDQVADAAVRDVLKLVFENLASFVHWPARALLLWQGCDRIARDGKRQKYHTYPAQLRARAKEHGIDLDTRPNGPAIASFQLSGGTRLERFGSANAWSIHHLYSGKFPYNSTAVTMHAAKEPNHFTQSAGLVAVHPIADALGDEYPFFAWALRVQAFHRFGYDPDHVFAASHDGLGFANGNHCVVIWNDQSEPAISAESRAGLK